MELEEDVVQQDPVISNIDFSNIQETVNSTISRQEKKYCIKNNILKLLFITLSVSTITLSSLLYICIITKKNETQSVQKDSNSILDRNTITVIYSFDILSSSVLSNNVIEDTISSLVKSMTNNTKNIGYEWFMNKEDNIYIGGSVIERYTSFDSFMSSRNMSKKWDTLHNITDMLVLNIDESESLKLLKEYPYALHTGKINYGFIPCPEKGRETTSDIITILYKFDIVNPSKSTNEAISSIVTKNVQVSLEEPGTIGYEWYFDKNEFGNYINGYILERYSSFGAFLPSHTPPEDPWKFLQTPVEIKMSNIPYYGKYILEEGGWRPYVSYMGTGMRYFGYSVCRW
jgi:quinol monooxygenase YgiN